MLVGAKGRRLKNRLGMGTPAWEEAQERRQVWGDQGRRCVVDARDQGVEGAGDKDLHGVSWAEVLTLQRKLTV